jgi:2-oxoglutarate/2-oxoacid ferredoxin oxidoreductase subunit alpha
MNNNFVLNVATVNGSGSHSANQLLVRTLFRMGLPVGGKNLFPSNIAGLATWFSIRVSPEGFTGRKELNDIVVALNPETFNKDLASLHSGGVFIFNQDLKLPVARTDILALPVPFRELSQQASDAIKIRKLLANMIYVGVLAELMDIDTEVLKATIADQFASKTAVLEVNFKAVELGRDYARSQGWTSKFPFKVKTIAGGNDGKILIDGNAAAALGLLYGGCSVLAWYPITPSSSLAESFHKYAEAARTAEDGSKKFAVIQAEDELAAINMVIGAGWAGARAITPTSGPGISLMSEAAGLAYFAEIPAVIWDVQRAGPSTGLPTRTMQGDLRAVANLSHGDTEHIVLLPGTPEECFEFGQTCFDLAEEVQTLVFVLSDLDLGMNLWIAEEFKTSKQPYKRGKVLSAEKLNEVEQFARYRDVDGDGIPYRTLPGTMHSKAAYFTRGTGHTESSGYSEENDNYRRLLERLRRKFITARGLVPKPIVEEIRGARTGIVTFGSTQTIVEELKHTLSTTAIGKNISTMRVRALPLSIEVEEFISHHEVLYVVEQNRDGQLREILTRAYPQFATRLRGVNQWDGLPIESAYAAREILRLEGHA